jgi:hypothetical protein
LRNCKSDKDYHRFILIIQVTTNYF